MHVGEGGMEAIPVPDSPSFLLLTVSFGHRVPDSMLDRVHSRSLALNLHPSLLPQLRGAAPIQWAIARQLATTGVTVQQLSKGTFDMGAILGQEPVQMPPGVSYHDLESLLAQRGAALLTDVLERLPECHEHRRAQDDALATRAPKLNAKVSHVRWDQWPAAAIVARHRAFAYMVSAKWHLSVLTKSVHFGRRWCRQSGAKKCRGSRQQAYGSGTLHSCLSMVTRVSMQLIKKLTRHYSVTKHLTLQARRYTRAVCEPWW